VSCSGSLTLDPQWLSHAELCRFGTPFELTIRLQVNHQKFRPPRLTRALLHDSCTYLPTNMAEPIPSASNAADIGDDETTQDLPANAEDRKAAAALNSLNANGMSQENGETANKQPSAADQEALGKAMSRLEIASGVSKKKDDPKKADAKKEVEVKKKVKIAAEDVAFLVRVEGLGLVGELLTSSRSRNLSSQR
jgi:hypothetical protein